MPPIITYTNFQWHDFSYETTSDKNFIKRYNNPNYRWNSASSTLVLPTCFLLLN
ncbi:hypothetical protein DYBT9623_04235 [Dyadobacter sp. CECT 9623]|uniref:Uncharacterized protein n=1 Tax=Dyadobacter linearis TaxID=2823330 RepID=A0ABM8UW22_9BACT|nr:hypothetical protein DYBT9623_04235 [Dyadobacter sp. CECT 9623]